MWQYDFHLFYEAGQAVLSGSSTYSASDFGHLYTHSILMAPLAIFPEKTAYLIYLALNLVLLIRLAGRRSLWGLLSFPVLFSLYVGQFGMTYALLVAMIGPWSAPLLMARPNLGFVVGPWLARTFGWPGIAKAFFSGLAILALSFIIRPSWFSEWQLVVPSLSTYAVRDSSIYYAFSPGLKEVLRPALSLIVLVIAFTLKSRRIGWSFTSFFIPASNIYSTAMLAEWFGPLEVILSWLAMFAVGGNIHSGAPMYWVSLSILFRRPLTWMLGWILSLLSTIKPSSRGSRKVQS